MKVILLRDVTGLGKRGEVKEIKDGYFKNYLLPKSLAKPFNLKTQKELEIQQRLIEAQAQKEIDKADKIKEALASLNLKFYLKVGEGGQAFGSITQSKILAELKSNGFELEKENIKFDEHIKIFGFHEIKINLGHGVETDLKIQVLPEAEESR